MSATPSVENTAHDVDVTSLRSLAQAEAAIAAKLEAVAPLVEQIIAEGQANSLEATRMLSGQEVLQQAKQCWRRLAAQHAAAADAATDMATAHRGKIGRDLDWAAGE